MAKIRRIIRKLKLPASHAFDDQLWPVILALCVLTGFVMGSIVAYLRFDDPRWYANAVTWLIATLLVAGGAAAALSTLDNRRLRRSMQLAILLGLLFHAVLFVTSIELHIFDRIYEVFIAQNDLSENKRPVTVPEYFETARRNEVRRDIERPVEVEIPEPEPDVQRIERDEPQPREQVEQLQPTPVPEPEETPRPNVMRREEAQETSPRYSDQQSQLSRRLTQSRPTPPSTQAADVAAQPTPSRPAALQARESTTERRQTSAQLTRRQPADEPSTIQRRPDVQIARRADQQNPEVQDSATPTFQRRLDPPVTVPRTTAELADAPAISERTNPNEFRPNTTLTQKRTTASPETNRARTEPVPETTTDVAAQPQRRESPTESRPDVAQTPVSIPNQRTRATPRPDVATTASRVTPDATPAPPQPQPRLLETPTSDVARTTLDRPVERRTVADEPATPGQQTAARVARRDVGQTPVPESATVNAMTPRRETPQPTVGASTMAQVTRPANVANDARQNQLEAAATTTQRQATASARVSRAAAVEPPESAMAAESSTTAPQPVRQPRSEPAPTVAQALRSLPARRPQPVAEPRPDTLAENVSAAAATPAAETTAAPQAAAAMVARAATGETVQRPQASPAEPTTAAQPATSPSIRRTTPETPPAQLAATSMAANTPQRNDAASVTAPATPTEAAQPSAVVVASSGATGEPTARATSAARQTTPTESVAQGPNVPATAPESPSTSTPQAATTRARVEPSPTAVAAAASVPAAIPRRAAESPAVSTQAVAQTPQAPAVASTDAGSSSAVPAASRVGASRQATPAPAAAGVDAVAGLATPTASTGNALSAPSATRRPRGAEAPQTAQTNVTSIARRESPTALPSATTVRADVAANLATSQSASDEPRPSSATVARQPTANPAAARSQQALRAQAAASSPQVARAATPRVETAAAPSLTPSADPNARPSRAALSSAVAASPTNVESPAVAAADRGVGEPSAAPARTAMSKAITGTAGIGSGRNLDRARPAADSPALVASASARRAESIQNTPQGPDLSPSAPALVRRSTAGQTTASASLQAQPIAEMATAAGAEQPAELAASASAAQRRADANATEGPTSAARGTTDVDLGATQIVSEGQAGRASGGGQPVLNFDTDSPQLARSELVGGAPLAALAETTVVEAPTAPPGMGGGQPPTPQTDMPATAVARTDPGGGQPISGGPSKATETGPPTEVTMATRAAEASVSRAELAEALPAPAAAGGGEDQEDEEEKRRRLARAASQLAAVATPTTADAPAVAGAGDGGDQPLVTAAAVSVARAAPANAAGASAGSAAATGPGDAAAVQVAATAASRAAAAEQTPEGPLVAASAAGAPQRSPGRAGAPSITTQADAVELAGAADAAATALAASPAAAVTRGSTGPAGALAAAQMTLPSAAAETAGVAPGAPAASRATAAAQPSGAAANAAASPSRSSVTAAPPAIALAAADVAPGGEPTAAGDAPGGGEPMSASATALVRSATGPAQPAMSGPDGSQAEATAEPSAQVAAAALRRSPATEAAPGQAGSGGGEPSTDTSASIDRAVARRASGGAPQLALAGPNPAEIPAGTGTRPAGGGAEGSPVTAVVALNPNTTTTARETGGGSPGVGGRGPTSEAGPAAGASGGDLLAATQFTRAEAVQAAAGPPEIGGGTQAPARAARGPALAANLQADTMQLAGMPESGGLTNGSPVAAQGLEATRLAGGANTTPAAGPVGAAEGPEVLDLAMAGAPGSSIGTRSSSPSTADGPAMVNAANLGSPLNRAGVERLPFHAAAVGMVDVPDLGGDEALVQASQDHNLGGLADDLPVSRQSIEGGLAVNIDAPAGTGGLGAEFTPDVGLNNRRASTESVQVQVRTARFVRQQVGGLPDFNTAAIVAAEPFQRRSDREPGDGMGGGNGSPPPMTEESIELGLAYLSRCQLEDGSWSLQSAGSESAALVTDTAATGLALLAFQGAGYNHREHKYADLINAAIQYLVKNQKPDGDLFVPLDDESNRSVWIYSHSIAALALCEAYGMTQDPALREPAQKAIDFLVAAQHPDRGGWRYSPQFGSDTSVTGWAMMALKSGELANLQVPEEAYDKIRHWLDKSQGGSDQPHLYSYNPYAPNTEEQRHGRRPSTTMTSVGLLMRLYLGWRRDNPNMIRGAEYLAENLPSLGSLRNPERDTYYWYYATQVMFHMGGDYWKAWNGKLHPLLVNSQIQQGPMAGSWDPRNPVPDRWSPHAGRLYVTTMNLISLEVYYRHLPLYEDTAR